MLYRHWKGRGEPFTLANTVCWRWRCSAAGKRHALLELERLGLITVGKAVRASRRGSQSSFKGPAKRLPHMFYVRQARHEFRKHERVPHIRSLVYSMVFLFYLSRWLCERG